MNAHDANDSEYPQPDAIYDLIGGAWKGFVLRAAVELEVFSAIGGGLGNLDRLAATKHWDLRATRLLLDSLCPLGLLDKSSGEYRLTPVSEAFLVPGSETYAVSYILAALATEASTQLATAVRTGQGPASNVGSHEWTAAWAQDAALESVSTWRIEDSREMWRTVGIDPDSDKQLRVLDVASGCGIKSFVLARGNPNALITCLDWPAVLAVADRLATRWGIADRVRVQPGDVTTLDYGESEFDAALLGQITFYWSREQNEAALKKVHRALKRGGRVVIHVHIGDETWRRSDAALMGAVTLLFSEGGDIYSFDHYQVMLANAGFSEVTRHSDLLVSAMKPT